MEGLIDQIIEHRENGLPVPNVGLSADMLTGYHVDGKTKVATEIRSVYSVDAVFYPASGGSFDRVLNSMAAGQKVEGGGNVKEKVKERAEEVAEVAAQVSDELKTGDEAKVEEKVGQLEASKAAEEAAAKAEDLLRAQCQSVLEGALTWCDLPQPMKDAVRSPTYR